MNSEQSDKKCWMELRLWQRSVVATWWEICGAAGSFCGNCFCRTDLFSIFSRTTFTASGEKKKNHDWSIQQVVQERYLTEAGWRLGLVSQSALCFVFFITKDNCFNTKCIKCWRFTVLVSVDYLCVSISQDQIPLWKKLFPQKFKITLITCQTQGQGA